MRTTKAIASISFNTTAYLIDRLQELTKAKIIAVWHFINHLPEDDEGGKKEHIHLYIEPSKLIQTEELAEHFKELDPSSPGRPLKCLPFRNSKFGDWYLYGLHDTDYLASKGQSRRYHYQPHEFMTSDPDELNRAVHMIDRAAAAPITVIKQAIAEGKSFAEVVTAGIIPIQQVGNYQKAWQFIMQGMTYRGDHAGHEVDAETGEVKE